MSTLIVGAGGQLGRELVATWTAHGNAPTALARADLDICDVERLHAALTAQRPRCVINAAAYTAVDACEEREHVREAFDVNAVAVRELARLCASLDATLVHFSTDFVFGGDQRQPFRERDAPQPASVYATSKLAGEHFARAYCPRHVVIRTCGLYGYAGPARPAASFVEKMLQLAAARRPIRVVDDQIVSPTSARDLARATYDLLQLEADGRPGYYGLYHITNSGQCSWYEFAAAIFADAGLAVDLSPTSSAAFAAAARRPSFSVLASARLQSLGLPALRPWREALRAYLAERATRRGDAAGA
jgi:dTDP-4-dehydrorhamnose reductase